MDTLSAHREEELPKWSNVFPGGGKVALVAFQNIIENDQKEVLLPSGFTRNSERLDFVLETSFSSFSLRFTGFRNKVDPESEVGKDIDFLESKTKDIYRTFYTGAKLDSVFAPSSGDKERYFVLMEKYLYSNYDAAVVEAWKKYPKPGILTYEETRALDEE